MDVPLSFGSAQGAWDDRDLIEACDVAMEEFHAHHPGPGTWLDKATAAQLAGRPLPGVVSQSEWYSVEAESGPSRASGHSAKRFRPSGNEGTAFHDATDKHNPYGHATSHIVSEGQAVSPRYAPPSPAGSVPERYASPTHAPIEPNIHQDAVRHDNQPAPPPPIGVHPTHTVSATDALGYAMASQYWAGYWMGIAQAQTGTSSPGAVAITSTDPSTNDSSALGGIASPANVRTTRRDHARQVNGGLRR